MSNAGLVVFSRFDSWRLPGKALLDVGGRPLLGRVLDRARRVPGGHLIVVATSDRPIDDPIAGFASGEGIAVFRGEAENVAARALACAEEFGFEAFARISGDSPFIDPVLVSRLLEMQEQGSADVATNVHPRSFPSGISVEVIATAALRRAVRSMTEPEDREHVTRFIYRYPGEFLIENFHAGDDRYARLDLAVDTGTDLEMAAWIVSRIDGPPEQAGLDDIATLAREWLTCSS
jgi:spore coat polysaccharide biosynthesis protein SpsF